MPTVHIMGYVEPRETLINIENLTPIQEENIVTGKKTKFTIAIIHSVVSVECEMENFDVEQESSQLYTRCVELSRTLVNLIAVRHGWGLTVHLDTFINEDGTEERLMNRADHLDGIMDAYTLDDIDMIFRRVSGNIDFTMALNDMVDAITRPRTTSTCCARVIDTIKNLLAPELKDKAGWEVMHEALRTDKEYCQHISNASRSSRHGQHEYLPSIEAEELMTRTWELFNRFLSFRISGGLPLDEEKFPILHHDAPTPQS
ncbi:MAG TPA: hypothetical protein VGU67_11780 [Edaphobacter sp.]|nr:hypothetical protein [Edaphobacter sp.]